MPLKGYSVGSWRRERFECDIGRLPAVCVPTAVTVTLQPRQNSGRAATGDHARFTVRT
jgi:hypothetical protein